MTEPTEAAAFEALLGRRSDHLFVIVDESLRILRAGPEAAAVAERPETELMGMSLIAAFGSASLDAVARQALTAGGASGEAALGHLERGNLRSTPFPLKRGGLVLSLHEITQLRRIERVRRDFVANIGHELRTPLTSIKLLAESLSSGAVDDLETMREFAGQVERETDHLAQLVDELLDLTMIESGETTLTTARIDPDSIVRDCVIRIGPVAERREIRVRELPGPADGVQAVADPERLGQALLNLAHNAVKYSHPGGEVRLGWEIGEAGRIRFTVSDDGIGVPEIHQPRIFERFYKVDRARTRDPGSPMGGSAGLGLSIVRHIAEAHGGAVGMISEEGVGSTFWIEVPSAAA